MDVMVERIEKLERSVRRFRWAGGVVVCLMVVGMVMGQVKSPQPRKLKTVEAERFVLKDVDGVIRGRWEVRENLPEKEEFLHEMKTLLTPAEFEKWRKRKMTLFSMGTETDANGYFVGPKVTLTSGENDARMSLGISYPSQMEDSRVVWEGTFWKYSKNHSAQFVIRENYALGSAGHKTIQGSWIASADGPSRISIIDKDGQDRAVLGACSTVTKSSGVTHQRPESSLVLFDEKGNVLHQVP